MTASPLLVAQDVSYAAPNGQMLLHNVNLSIDQGAVLAVAGPNGAGKTTLITLLAGLTNPGQGEIRFKGERLSALPAHQKASQIALVSQKEKPDARLTLRDYVALGQIPIWAEHAATEHAEALHDVLVGTDLLALADKTMAQLSGGEQQRAHIARAMAQRPQLLFLDEPTNHLDPDSKGQMLSLISGLGITVVMILHDLVLIPEFATDVALLNDTRLTDFGPVDHVLTPERVRKSFGVDYLQLAYQGRTIPALDIRKQPTSSSRTQQDQHV